MLFKSKYLKYSIPILLFILLITFAKVKNRAICTITPAILNSSDVDGSSVNLRWTNGRNSKATFLNVSASKSLKSDKSLEIADIVNDVVTDKDSYLKNNLKPGTYYWNIIADGCRQREISDFGSFTIQSTANTNCAVTPAVLNPPIVKDSKVTLSWTGNPNAAVGYINISSSNIVNADGILQDVDIANDVVTDRISFTKEGLRPRTYYWNIVRDNCGQRTVSSLSTFTIQY